MSTQSLLEQLEQDIRSSLGVIVGTDLLSDAAESWADRLSAIRAAVGGEAVAWMLRRKRDDFVRGCYATKPTAESLEFAELDGDYYTPLYASPPATVDVGALRELHFKYNQRSDNFAFNNLLGELAALIGKEA